VYVTGYSYGSGTDRDYATIRYSASDGSQTWVSRYNGPDNSYDRAYAIAVDNSGGVYVTGCSIGSATSYDYATIRYSASDGSQTWVSRYNGPDNSYDLAYAIAVDNSGGVYVTGISHGFVTSIDYATIRYSASDGSQTWVSRYNGPDNNYDYAQAIAVDGSGNAYVTGYSPGLGTSTDYATIKYDANGNQQWVARYNGPSNADDIAYAIAVDGSGNAYVTGNSPGSGTGYDYATVKYSVSGGSQTWVSRWNRACASEFGQKVAFDANGYVYACGYGQGSIGNYDYITIKYSPTTGEALWVRYYNGLGNGDDQAYAIAVDNSGGVYVTGTNTGSGTSYDYATVKYDANGTLQWVARYNGPGNSSDYAYAIAADGSGNAYVAGRSYGSGSGDDYATIKYDANGNQQWVARYNGPGNSADYAQAIAVDGSGNAYVTGYSPGLSTSTDYATVKYDANGNEQWVARYNGPGNGTDVAIAITVDGSGSAYVTGGSAGTSMDYATVKYDVNGNQQWVARYNGPGNFVDVARGIAVDDLGNAYVTGYSGGSGFVYDYATVKYDASGNEQWVARYNGPGNSYDGAYAIAVDNSGGVYVTGYSTGSGTGYDYATLMYNGANGNQLDCKRYTGPGANSDEALSIATGPDGAVAVTGHSYVPGQYDNIVTIKYLGLRPDVGVTEILEPSGVIDTLSEIPQATVHNFGTSDFDLTAWFEIRYGTSDGTVQYLQSAPVYGLGSVDQTVAFPLWDVPNNQEGLYYAKSWTVLDGDIDETNDTARSMFMVKAQPQSGLVDWTEWPDVPAGPQGRVVQHGAAMATDPDGRYAYLLKGNNTCEFDRLDAAMFSWSALDPIPELGRDNEPRTVKEGGTLAQVGGKFYATKGGNCLEFWEYDPAAAQGCRWTQKADVPAGAAGVHSGASATGVSIGINRYVYFLKASATFEFYRYDVANDNWQAMATAPGPEGQEFKTGSSISFDGTDTIFALKGIFNKFYAYSVATNTWSGKPDLPPGPNNKQAKGGAAICHHLRHTYCLKGSNSQEFWIFHCDDNAWRESTDVPLGAHKTRVQDGGALVYCRQSRYLFATKGNCLEFWAFGRLSNFGTQSDEVVDLDAAVKRLALEVSPSVTNSRARVRYALPKAGSVGLKLYEVTGRCAAVLRNGWCEPGRYTAAVDAGSLARGVYILKLQSDAGSLTRKVVIE